MTDLRSRPEIRPTLFIVCGLPGSGKSTHALVKPVDTEDLIKAIDNFAPVGAASS